MLNDQDILAFVKTRASITHPFLDDTFLGYIQDVRDYAISAGVTEVVMYDQQALGLYYRGCIDSWNFLTSEGSWSRQFHERVIQLAYNPRAVSTTPAPDTTLDTLQLDGGVML